LKLFTGNRGMTRRSGRIGHGSKSVQTQGYPALVKPTRKVPLRRLRGIRAIKTWLFDGAAQASRNQHISFQAIDQALTPVKNFGI
jgi:hypothetical protein